jgi:NAD(P)-dependent dehydrogenase (short-subunit alcohol dehydrogenase family)
MEGASPVSRHLEGKSVVVTGGGRGIGRAIALAAAKEGASVVIADYGGAVDRNEAGPTDAADAVVAEISKAGGEAVAAAIDVSTMDGGRAAVELAVDSFGRLDAMVCSAGITVTKYLWELEEQEWDDVINVHLKGHFSCAKAAARVMVPQHSGSLVFFSSGALNGMPNVTAYAAAKAGILGFTWSTANALGRFGITTNCMVPSAATRMSDNIYGNVGKLTDRFGDAMRSDLAPGTYRDPANVAPFAIYLMSDAARQINGQIFRVQGYEVGRLGMLRYAPTMTNLGPWDVDSLVERVPSELGPDLQPLPMPWPEPEQNDDIEFTA